MGAGEIAMTVQEEGAVREGGLKICYIFPQFPVQTEVFAVSDIAALRALGHQVVVHTVKPARRDADRLARLCGVPADLPVSRPSFRKALGWPRLLWVMRSQALYLFGRIFRHARRFPGAAAGAVLSMPRVLEIAEEIRRFDPDVVHIFWSRHAGMALPVLAAQAVRAVRSAFAGAYDLVADDFLLDLTLEWSRVIFSHSDANRAFLEAKAPPGVEVSIVRRGIPLLELDQTAVRDPDLWLTASALVPAKNVEAVLRGFAQARRTRPGLRLDVFGEGPDRDRLERVAAELGCADAVRFGGHVEREQLFRHMQQAQAFLLLSKKASERLPNVVKEAMWAGCAIVSSNSQGIEELVPDPGMGWVVDPDDDEALTQALAGILKESEEAAQARRDKARRHIAEHFSSAQSMRAYEAAWRKVRGADRRSADASAGKVFADHG